MRRLLTLLLLVVLELPAGLPVMAAVAGSTAVVGEAGLPACCRRGGAHHCAMSAAERLRVVGDGVRVGTPVERCPYCPASVAGTPHAGAMGVPAAGAIYAGLVSHPAGTAQTRCRWRVARERARGKRGPPVA